MYYMIGEPGVGKSLLARLLVSEREPDVKLAPFALLLTGAPTVIEIGTRREQFSGTDALSMSVQPDVLRWLVEREGEEETYIAEGDRLANDKFFTAVLAMGMELKIAHLVAPPLVVERRLRFRNQETGKSQNETWLAGRRTKVRNLAVRWQPHVFVVNTDDPMFKQMSILRQQFPNLWLSESTRVLA